MVPPETGASVEKLLAFNALLDHENQRLLAVLRSQERRLAELEGKDPQQAELALLEELSEMGLELDEQETEEEDSGATDDQEEQAEEKKRKPRRGHGPREQAALPVEEKLVELPEQERDCPACGGELKPMGDQTEDSEEITVVLERYVRVLHRRQKYRCSCNGAVVTAPAPLKLIPGGRYSLDFTLNSVVAKYCDHLPLTRQTRRMGRQGLEITTQTLWDQHEALATILEPTWQRLGELVLDAGVLHADESGWRLAERNQAKVPWAVWTLSTPDIAWYSLLSSKSEKAARKLLAPYRGILVADGYVVYQNLVRAGPERLKFRLAHCWAHALRKFRDCLEHRPKECREILGLIAALYKVERELSANGFPGDECVQQKRHELRQEHSRKIVAQIKEWAFAQAGLPRSDFGRAVRYMLNRWDGLTAFLDNPQVPLDNNHAERALRGPVVGRKNYYGSRSKRGCQVAAILYSLCETAKLRVVDPHVYLKIAAERALRAPGTVTLPADI